MAHIVKCKFCGQQFDRDKNPFVKLVNRYAHPQCHENYLNAMTQEDKDKEEFYQYVKQLFGKNFNYVMTKKLADKYIAEGQYTYHNMTKALQWFYEIQQNPIDKANGTIGIIPYCYNRAAEYYYNLYLAKMINNEKDLSKYIPTVKEVYIDRPTVKVKLPKLFNMEDE